MPSLDDDQDLPSLTEIFSRPSTNKRSKNDPSAEKENEKAINVVKNSEKLLSALKDSARLETNTAIFAYDSYNSIYVPGIIKEYVESLNAYSVEFYNGTCEVLGRVYIVCPDDPKFYSIRTVPLQTVLKTTDQSLSECSMLKFIDALLPELEKILLGYLESERDIAFRSSSKCRASLNSSSSTGPFTCGQHEFLLEHFSGTLLTSLLDSGNNRSLCEKRFLKSGDALDHLLRQYAYLVLVPEFILRHIVKTESISVEEANLKLLDSSCYDLKTKNYINYLYSKQEMYRYARRELRGDEK